jgi:hypothetical protein
MDHKFHFTPPFLESFKETINVMSEKLNELNTMKDMDVYGICNCSYRMRYFTPKDVSAYITYAHKGMQNNLIGSNPYDIELFAVESAKRFLVEHDCDSFECSSIMGNSFADKERPTLQDLLLIHSNEVHNKVVRTPYELKEIYKEMKKDINIFNDMHFPANMKKIVDQLPNIISKMDGGEIYENEPLIGNMFRAMIEEFIIFVTTINMITVASMVDYCKPSTVYKSSDEIKPLTPEEGDDDVVVKESVDTDTNSPVYFVFAEGKTRFISDAIKKATKSPFSHISIAFDPSLNPMYSFGGKRTGGTYESKSGGVVREDIHDKYYNDIDVTVYGVYMPNDKVDEMKKICNDYVKNADKTTFDYGILLKKLIRKDGSLPKNEYRQVCSTFINHLFKSVNVNVTDKNIPSPAELKNEYDVKSDQFHPVYTGKAHDIKSETLEKRMITFANGRKSKPINEYALLKTNVITQSHQLPFNFNIRTVVLSDTSVNFDNTLSAIKFMLNDSRSPINELLVKFATIKRESHISIEMIKQAFITHHRCPSDNPTCKDDIGENGFNKREPQWLDKIVYGSQYMDSNYRDDTPGIMHYHPITYDISTIYRMFSCHHNDNEHLANNIVKIANVMRGLIDDYRGCHYTPRETLCDILTVFGEILTKDVLMLYHNNNQTVVYRDDMNDTMIPGYMYCESFIMEVTDDNQNNTQQTNSQSNTAQQPGANSNSNKNPTVVNKGNVNDGTKMQNLKFKVKDILQKFAEYIRQTLSQISSKFNANHKAEKEWIKSHKQLNDEISKSISDGTFSIQIQDYPYFNIPFSSMDQGIKQSVDELKKHLGNVEELQRYISEKGGVDTIAKSLIYPDIRDEVNIKNENDIREKVRNYVCYGTTKGIEGKEKDPMLSKEMWDETISMLSDDKGVFKVVEELTKTTNESLKTITDSLQKLANAEKKNATNNQQSNQGENNKPTGNPDSDIMALFNTVNNITKNCYLATLSFLMKDVYGKTYNMYRSIVLEYERQKTNGTNNNSGETQNANNNTTQTSETNTKEGNA